MLKSGLVGVMRWLCHLRPEALPGGLCSPETQFQWCQLSSARRMDGPRVSVLIVMRVTGFQSSRDQVVGLTVRSHIQFSRSVMSRLFATS